MGKYCTVRKATDDNIIRRMRIACWIPKATETHSEYVTLLPSRCNNGCTNAPHCCFIRTLSWCELFRAFKRSRRQCAVTVVICCVKMRCCWCTQRSWHTCPLESDVTQFGTCVMLFRRNLPLPSSGQTKQFHDSCSGRCG